MISTYTMRAMQIHSYDGSEQLKLEETPRPAPKASEALVRVHAAGVQPIDWQIPQGMFKASQPVTFPFIPGIEVAGVVEEVGPDVTADLIGQAVLGQITMGGYAEYVSVPVRALARKPKALSFIEAAAFPVGAITAWRALFDIAGVTAGQQVLIQGATSGMGLFAVQLAKWKGARVIGTAPAMYHEFVRSLGAELVVDSTAIPAERMDLVVLGPGATVSSALAALRDGGTLMSNAALRPEEQEQARTRGIRAVTSRGTTAVPLDQLVHLAEEGYLRAPVGKAFALREAAQSHAYAQSGQGFGRFALRVVEEDSLLS